MRLIDADELLSLWGEEDGDLRMSLAVARQNVMDMPTIEPEQRRTRMSLIDKDAVISILKRDAADGNCMTLIADSTAREIVALPTIEAEPVVRCKDCKHSVMTVRGECKYCKEFDPDCFNKVYLSGEFYCLFGERKDEVEE